MDALNHLCCRSINFVGEVLQSAWWLVHLMELNLVQSAKQKTLKYFNLNKNSFEIL